MAVSSGKAIRFNSLFCASTGLPVTRPSYHRLYEGAVAALHYRVKQGPEVDSGKAIPTIMPA